MRHIEKMQYSYAYNNNDYNYIHKDMLAIHEIRFQCHSIINNSEAIGANCSRGTNAKGRKIRKF